MDQLRLTEALSLPNATPLYFTALEMLLWGRGLYFSCEALLDDESLYPFVLQLDDCREMRWQIYTHLPSDNPISFPRTHLASLKLGRDQHRSPLHLLTDHFGLSLMYGALSLRVGDEVISVG